MNSGDFLYLSNSTCQSSSFIGGMAPAKGFHSTMERPDSVSLVSPPNTTMPYTNPPDTSSQDPTTFCLQGIPPSPVTALAALTAPDSALATGDLPNHLKCWLKIPFWPICWQIPGDCYNKKKNGIEWTFLTGCQVPWAPRWRRETWRSWRGESWGDQWHERPQIFQSQGRRQKTRGAARRETLGNRRGQGAASLGSVRENGEERRGRRRRKKHPVLLRHVSRDPER